MFSSGPSYPKLKTNLRLSINRLKLLEKKKTELAQKARKEIADYIGSGKVERAKIRVEHIIREDYLVEAMEVTEMYCDLVLARFGLVQQMKDLDSGMSEAVSSLIWCAPRLMTDVPELKIVGEQFAFKYGKQYAQACREQAVSTISERLIHKLSVEAPPKILVEKYLQEIAASYNLEYTPDPQVMREHEWGQDTLINLVDPNNLNGPGDGATGGGAGGGGGISMPMPQQPFSYPNKVPEEVPSPLAPSPSAASPLPRPTPPAVPSPLAPSLATQVLPLVPVVAAAIVMPSYDLPLVPAVATKVLPVLPSYDTPASTYDEGLPLTPPDSQAYINSSNDQFVPVPEIEDLDMRGLNQKLDRVNSLDDDTKCPSLSIKCWAPSVLLTNPQSLTNCFQEFKDLVELHKPDVVVVSETWFSESRPASNFKLPGYLLFHDDREFGRRGGGVAVYAKTHTMRDNPYGDDEEEVDLVPLNPHTPEIKVPPELECLWVCVGGNTYVCGVYHPPRAQTGQLLYDHIVNTVLNSRKAYTPGISSEQMDLSPSSTHGDKAASIGFNFTLDGNTMPDYLESSNFGPLRFIIAGDLNELAGDRLHSCVGLRNLVQEPTHLNNTLDIVMTDTPSHFLPPLLLPPLHASKHNCVLVQPLHRGA